MGIRKGLTKFVSDGPAALWTSDLAPLLALTPVAPRAGDAETLEALYELLRAGTERVSSGQYRALLGIVLGVEPEYRDLPLSERRAIAAAEFRGGRSPVKPGTIRQHHEPRALDALARVLSAYPQSTPHGNDHEAPSRGVAISPTSPFGTPDGNATGREAALSSFVAFSGRRFRSGLGMSADDRSVRVIVGSKGSGKTLYLRRLQATAARERSLYADAWQPNPPATHEVVRVAEWGTSDSDIVDRWERIWRRATVTSALSHVFGSADPRFEAVRADHRERLDAYASILPSLDVPQSIYSRVSDVLLRNGRATELDTYLSSPAWSAVDAILSDVLNACPPMLFYLDALDERFEAAPHPWLLCQLGLFRHVVSSRSEVLGSRLHVVMTLRDFAFSVTQASEHATRYVNSPSIRVLNWDAEAIRLFLRSKIAQLPSDYLAMPDREPTDVEGWLGFREILNERRAVVEPVEDYLIRHTRLIPRDIIVLGNALCARADHRIDLGEALSEQDIREVVAHASRRFGQEQFAVAANHVAATMMPREAARWDLVDTYIGSDLAGPSALQIHVAGELVKLVARVKTDRFAASVLDELLQAADTAFPGVQDLGSILWQHRLLGYINDDVRTGAAVFYGSAADSELVLPREKRGYALHPVVLDAVPGLRGAGSLVVPWGSLA